MTVDIYVGNVRSLVSGISPNVPGVRPLLNEHLSCYVAGYKYTKKYKQWLASEGKAGWDGRARLVDPHGRFLTGNLTEVVRVLSDSGLSVHIHDGRPRSLRS